MSDQKHDDKDLQRIAEQAAGIFAEKIKDDLQLVLESVVDTNRRVRSLPTRDEFNELKAEVHIIKLAVRDTNSEFRQWKNDWNDD